MSYKLPPEIGFVVRSNQTGIPVCDGGVITASAHLLDDINTPSTMLYSQRQVEDAYDAGVRTGTRVQQTQKVKKMKRDVINALTSQVDAKLDEVSFYDQSSREEAWNAELVDLVAQQCIKAYETEVDTWEQMKTAGLHGAIKRQGAKAIRTEFGIIDSDLTKLVA